MSPLPKSKIKVLIVEDSPLIQQLLSYIFAQDAQFQVVGTADDAAPVAVEAGASLADLVEVVAHGEPTRVGFKILEDGRKVRIARKSGEVIDG